MDVRIVKWVQLNSRSHAAKIFSSLLVHRDSPFRIWSEIWLLNCFVTSTSMWVYWRSIDKVRWPVAVWNWRLEAPKTAA